MITAGEVLVFLCPGVEFSISGQEFEGITWHSGKAPITKKQFEDGFAQLQEHRNTEQAKSAEAKKSAEEKLIALGLTLEDIKALGLA